LKEKRYKSHKETGYNLEVFFCSLGIQRYLLKL
jgi:hypothetical protein